MPAKLHITPLNGLLTAALAVFILTLAACESVITVDLPEHEPKLVMNTFLDPELPFWVYVSHSEEIFSAADAGNRPITDAMVIVWEEGREPDTLRYVDTTLVAPDSSEFRIWGYLSTSRSPEPGHMYRVSASHPDYPPVWGEVSIPEVPENRVLSLNFDYDVLRDPAGRPLSLLKMRLDNPDGGLHYYTFRVWIKYEFEDESGDLVEAYGEFNLLEDDEGGLVAEKFRDEFYFTSELFPDPEQEVELITEINADFQDPGLKNLRYTGWYLLLRECSPSYYTYMFKLKAHLKSQGSGIPLFGGEPVQMPSNVSGGLGVVGAYSSWRAHLPY
jgi:hypothetical protein